MTSAPPSAAAQTLRDWLRERPFSLCLSSGFFGFFAHAGVVSVLEEEKLLPARLAGSSAGALVAGLWAAGLPAQELKRELFALRREQFWDPGLGLGLLRGAKFQARLAALLPVTTFDLCRIPLGLSVFEWRSRSTQVVESGPLAPALHASCAVPFLFQPVLLGGRRCADGGVLDRHGLASLDSAPGRGERVLYHHLSTRSPWRRKGSPALAVPKRAGLRALVVDGLPRLGPFKLEKGPEAFERAAEATRTALDAGR